MRRVSNPSTTTDPVLPEVKMNLVPANSPVEGTVVSNDMCLKGKSNAFVRHTEIDVSGTPLAESHRLGCPLKRFPARIRFPATPFIGR